jgi:alpha-aminoadipate carrier protein LysW
MTSIVCTECAAEFLAQDSLEMGEILVCPDCGVNLEVTDLNPLAVAPAPMEEEDWGE